MIHYLVFGGNILKEIIAGIYGIKNKKDGKLYIGYSKNICVRWGQHRSDFRNNKHDNEWMQKVYNKYGKDIFEFP